jgi:hypothetical protein
MDLILVGGIMKKWMLLLAALFFGFWGARGVIYAILASQYDALVFHLVLFAFALIVATDNSAMRKTS